MPNRPPNPHPTLLRLALSTLTSASLRAGRREGHRLLRGWSGNAPTVHYFHQPDDPYSHLAVQTLAELRRRYAVVVCVHLVSAPAAEAAPERDKLAAYGRRDASLLARRWGLRFPEPWSPAKPDRTARVAAALAAGVGGSGGPDWEALAVRAGTGLFSGDDAELARLPCADPTLVAAAFAEGDALRARRGHYLGATFTFEGEWYWGVDRLHYLETRLVDAGLARVEAAPLYPPREPLTVGAPPVAGPRPVLQLFGSLRSPYTYLAAARARLLARTHGAELRLRPILPMVMRGLPVPRSKQLYILLDAKREAERLGLPFGDIVDPVGAGALRGLAVLHAAAAEGRDVAFFEAFLRGVWAEGIDAATDRGLRRLADRAGLSGAFVDAALARQDFRATAEENRAALFALGLWGPPTFQVDDRPAHWGQDRLWAVEQDLLANASRHRVAS